MWYTPPKRSVRTVGLAPFSALISVDCSDSVPAGRGRLLALCASSHEASLCCKLWNHFFGDFRKTKYRPISAMTPERAALVIFWATYGVMVMEVLSDSKGMSDEEAAR